MALTDSMECAAANHQTPKPAPLRFPWGAGNRVPLRRTFFCFLRMLTLYKMLECLGNVVIFSLVPITFAHYFKWQKAQAQMVFSVH